MDNKINLSQLADLLSQAGGMSKSASEQFVKNFFDIISQSVLSDGLVKVKGLGTFKLLDMEDRESVNVNTGERFTIEGHQKISFTPDADLKERINKPFSAFETVEISEEQANEIAKMDAAADAPKADAPKTDAPKAETPKKEAARKDAPAVKDVTQKKSTRIILKAALWLCCIVVILFVGGYVFWPLIGAKLLELSDRYITDGKERKIELVLDSATIVQPAQPIQPNKVEPAQLVQPDKVEPAQLVHPNKVEPAQPIQPNKVEPAKAEPVKTTPAKAEPVKAEPAQAIKTLKVKLTASDEAKDLSEFTKDDVVNYVIDGDLDLYTLKKGETLTQVALKYYGSKKLWPYIVKYNNISDPGKLQPGARIRVPVLKSK